MASECPEPLVTCWCGAVGTYDELFADDFPLGCGGTGFLECECGGDLCVCHHHGEPTECPGCDECDEGDEGRHDDDYDPRDYEADQ